MDGAGDACVRNDERNELIRKQNEKESKNSENPGVGLARNFDSDRYLQWSRTVFIMVANRFKWSQGVSFEYLRVKMLCSPIYKTPDFIHERNAR